MISLTPSHSLFSDFLSLSLYSSLHFSLSFTVSTSIFRPPEPLHGGPKELRLIVYGIILGRDDNKKKTTRLDYLRSQ